ncbi:MAG: hypothetical protein H0X51_04610 [Parachlamydiaceae bacterium]|nr:hypothetical protein [Parachlamydiaceae bacterium]
MSVSNVSNNIGYEQHNKLLEDHKQHNELLKDHFVVPNPLLDHGKLSELYIEKFTKAAPLVVKGAASIAYSYRAHVFDAFLKMLRVLPKTTGGAVERYDWLFKAVKLLQFVPLISGICALRLIRKETKDLVSGMQGREETAPDNRSEVGLRIGEGVAALADAVASVFSTLKFTGLATQTALTIGSSFSFAGTFLWLASVVLHVKQLRGDKQHWKSIQDILGKNPQKPNYDAALTKMQQCKMYQLSQHYGVDGEILMHQIEGIQRVNFTRSDEENARVSKALFGALEERIVDKNVSHKLAIVSSVITFIGMLVFLCTPFASLAYAAIAIGVMFSFAKTKYDNKSIARLETKVKLIAPAPELIPATIDVDGSSILTGIYLPKPPVPEMRTEILVDRNAFAY